MTARLTNFMDENKKSPAHDIAEKILMIAIPEHASVNDMATAMVALIYAQGAMICGSTSTKEERLEGAKLANEQLLDFINRSRVHPK